MDEPQDLVFDGNMIELVSDVENGHVEALAVIWASSKV